MHMEHENYLLAMLLCNNDLIKNIIKLNKAE